MAAFTTIAATTLGAAGSAFNFVQAGKQAALEREANEQAKQALQQARDRLGQNMLEGLQVAREPFDLEREALMQAGASALQAGIEGDQRGAGAVAGQVLMAQQAQQSRQRADFAREQQRVNEMQAREASRLQGELVGIDKAEVMGQQARAADAREARAQALQAGAEGLLQTGLGFMESSGDAFSGSSERQAARRANRLDRIESNRGLDARNRVGSRMFQRDLRRSGLEDSNPALYNLIQDESFGNLGF